MIDSALSFVGMSEYLDAPHGQLLQESQSRIYVKFQPDGIETPQLALLDCGAHYCILSREVVDACEHRLTEPIGWRTFQTTFGRVRGQLYLTGVLDRIQWAVHPGVNRFFFGPLA